MKLFYFFAFLFGSVSSLFSHTIELCNPLDLVTPSRFDVMAKYIYAKNRDLGIKSEWPLEVYAEHLRVWGNFTEGLPQPHFPHYHCAKQYYAKNGLNQFVDHFNKMLDQIKMSGFDEDKSVIPIDKDNIIIDGSHRVAAALVYNAPVSCERFSHSVDQASRPTAKFFKDYSQHVSGGIDEKYLDAMALEYTMLNKNSFIFLVYPVTKGAKQNEIEEILNKYGEIVYQKKIYLYGMGPSNLMRILYEGESWVGDWSNKFRGSHGQARGCFPAGEGEVRIFLFETDSLQAMVKAKKEVRALFGVGNYAAHANDTHEQAIQAAQAVFVKNSIDFLNLGQVNYCAKFEKFFSEYKQWLEKNDLDKRCFCIDGSAIMSAYGLRDCNDLDFLHCGFDKVALNTGNIHFGSHNDEMKYHAFARDDIIANPEYHFYHRGLKFASLEVLRAMKSKRNEQKDVRDVQIMNSLLAYKR